MYKQCCAPVNSISCVDIFDSINWWSAFFRRLIAIQWSLCDKDIQLICMSLLLKRWTRTSESLTWVPGIPFLPTYPLVMNCKIIEHLNKKRALKQRFIEAKEKCIKLKSPLAKMIEDLCNPNAILHAQQ